MVDSPPINHSIETQMTPEIILDELQKVAVFRSLSKEELELLLTCSELRTFYKGATIFEESDTSNDLYVILRGRVSLRLESIAPHYEMVITSIGEREVIGEMSLLSNQPRSTTVVCSEPSELLKFNGATLRALFEQRPHLGYVVVTNLARLLSERLNYMNRRLLGIFQSKFY